MSSLANAYEQLALQASLHYVSDTMPGISRKRKGTGFAYFAPDGTHIGCQTTIGRIKRLAIPPAYEKVWICPLDNGHLQATGRDERQRKQYRYHPEWDVVRDQTKFANLTIFSKALPSLRERVEQDIRARDAASRRAVMAAMVMILDETAARVGNRLYAKEHGTYGLTTLRKKHVEVDTKHAVFDFPGKNSTRWHLDLTDKRLLRVVRACEDIPGYHLFQYRDAEGEKHSVDSAELNAYLQDVSGQPITAKMFRTWAACTLLYEALQDTPLPESERQTKIAFNAAIKRVAQTLGHTPAVCKKSYIAPEIETDWRAGTLPPLRRVARDGLDFTESAFLRWWENRG